MRDGGRSEVPKYEQEIARWEVGNARARAKAEEERRVREKREEEVDRELLERRARARRGVGGRGDAGKREEVKGGEISKRGSEILRSDQKEMGGKEEKSGKGEDVRGRDMPANQEKRGPEIWRSDTKKMTRKEPKAEASSEFKARKDMEKQEKRGPEIWRSDIRGTVNERGQERAPDSIPGDTRNKPPNARAPVESPSSPTIQPKETRGSWEDKPPALRTRMTDLREGGDGHMSPKSPPPLELTKSPPQSQPASSSTKPLPLQTAPAKRDKRREKYLWEWTSDGRDPWAADDEIGSNTTLAGRLRKILEGNKVERTVARNEALVALELFEYGMRCPGQEELIVELLDKDWGIPLDGDGKTKIYSWCHKEVAKQMRRMLNEEGAEGGERRRVDGEWFDRLVRALGERLGRLDFVNGLATKGDWRGDTW